MSNTINHNPLCPPASPIPLSSAANEDIFNDLHGLTPVLSSASSDFDMPPLTLPPSTHTFSGTINTVFQNTFLDHPSLSSSSSSSSSSARKNPAEVSIEDLEEKKPSPRKKRQKKGKPEDYQKVLKKYVNDKFPEITDVDELRKHTGQSINKIHQIYVADMAKEGKPAYVGRTGFTEALKKLWKSKTNIASSHSSSSSSSSSSTQTEKAIENPRTIKEYLEKNHESIVEQLKTKSMRQLYDDITPKPFFEYTGLASAMYRKGWRRILKKDKFYDTAN